MAKAKPAVTAAAISKALNAAGYQVMFYDDTGNSKSIVGYVSLTVSTSKREGPRLDMSIEKATGVIYECEVTVNSQLPPQLSFGIDCELDDRRLLKCATLRTAKDRKFSTQIEYRVKRLRKHTADAQEMFDGVATALATIK